jgi:hypothetical protein
LAGFVQGDQTLQPTFDTIRGRQNDQGGWASGRPRTPPSSYDLRIS